MCHEHFNKSFNKILDKRVGSHQVEKGLLEEYLMKEFGLVYDRRSDINWAEIPARHFYKILDFLEINSFDDFLYGKPQITVEWKGLWCEGEVVTL